MTKALRKTLLLSASVLMLASVGSMTASALNNPVHASRVRTSRRVRVHKTMFKSHGLSNRDLAFAESYRHTHYYLPNWYRGAKQIAKGSHYKTATSASGYVWGVLKHSGFNVSAQPWTPDNMLSNQGGTLQPLRANQARRGDVIVTKGENGTTGLLMQRYHGKRTKVLSLSNQGVRVHTVAWLNYNHADLEFGCPVKAMAVKRTVINKRTVKRTPRKVVRKARRHGFFYRLFHHSARHGHGVFAKN